MIYTQSFKEQCFRTLQFCSTIDISKLLKDMDSGRDTLVRYQLEDAVDDEELYEKDVVKDDGDRIVLNSKINAYKARVMLYSLFMEDLITEMDKEKEGVLV